MTLGRRTWKPHSHTGNRLGSGAVLEWQQSSETHTHTPTHTPCISWRTSYSNIQRETGTETALQKLHLSFGFPQEAKDGKASAKLPENRSGQMQSLVQVTLLHFPHSSSAKNRTVCQADTSLNPGSHLLSTTSKIHKTLWVKAPAQLDSDGSCLPPTSLLHPTFTNLSSL